MYKNKEIKNIEGTVKPEGSTGRGDDYALSSF